MSMTDEGAKKLIAAILQQAYEDYTKTDQCPPTCPMIDSCDNKASDSAACSAKQFIHSAWCASLCDGIGVDHDKYVEGTIDKCRLTKNVFKYIEGELRAYNQMRKDLEMIKDDIIFTAPEQQEGHSNTPGDPTMQKAIKIHNRIYSSPQLQQMQKNVDAIRKVYYRCGEQKRQVIELCYWNQRYTLEGLAYKLDVTRKTVYNWRKQIIYAIAIELNYL